MDKPVVRFAIVATVVGAVALVLFERIVPCQSGVVRAEEKKEKEEEKKKKEEKKEEVGLGFTYRQRQTQTQPGMSKPIEMTSTVRVSPEYGIRRDSYAQGKAMASTYVNYADGTTVSLLHPTKTYRHRTGPKGPPSAGQYDPRPRIKNALAGEHAKLGRRTIDGVEAEGIEVQNPEGFGSNFEIDSAAVQFWSSVETGDPILVEQNVVGGGGAIRIKTIDDQFRWNLRFDPNEFQAKIPPDYQLDTRQPGQGGRLGGFGRGSTSGSAGTRKSGQKARK